VPSWGGVGCGVGVGVGDGVGLGVGVAVGVGVGVGVPAAAGVGVAVSLAVATGVGVREPVGVVGLTSATLVGVRDDGAVPVAAAVGDGPTVPAGLNFPCSSWAASTWLALPSKSSMPPFPFCSWERRAGSREPPPAVGAAGVATVPAAG
jgi:hypothetical protein